MAGLAPEIYLEAWTLEREGTAGRSRAGRGRARTDMSGQTSASTAHVVQILLRSSRIRGKIASVHGYTRQRHCIAVASVFSLGYHTSNVQYWSVVVSLHSLLHVTFVASTRSPFRSFRGSGAQSRQAQSSHDLSSLPPHVRMPKLQLIMQPLVP